MVVDVKTTEELKQFRAMTGGEMSGRLAELYEEQFRLRTQKATGQLTRTARMREVRRQIAQIQTLLAERNQ